MFSVHFCESIYSQSSTRVLHSITLHSQYPLLRGRHVDTNALKLAVIHTSHSLSNLCFGGGCVCFATMHR